MKYLVVIPARGGSKGIPKKNIALLAGKPLLEYTIEAALDSKINADIVVSTDAEDIAEVAKKYSVEVIRRPDEIATDQSSTEETLIHALDYMNKKYGKEYEAVITMQPTSPFRTAQTIKQFLNAYETRDTSCDALLTLSEDRTDFWIRNADGLFCRLYPDAPRRRQERMPLYRENSCLYITEKNALLQTRSVLGNKADGFIISEKEGLDINETIDLIIADSMLKAR